MSIKGKVKNGVVVLDEARTLPEGMEVDVIVTAELLSNGLEKFVGTLRGPKDFAQQHDHYIHGTPKK